MTEGDKYVTLIAIETLQMVWFEQLGDFSDALAGTVTGWRFFFRDAP